MDENGMADMIKLKMEVSTAKREISRKIPGMISFLVILTLFSCVAPSQLTREIPVSKEPPTGLYQMFLRNYRMKAIEHEGKGDFQKAILYWQIVACFAPKKEEAQRAIKKLSDRVKIESERHSGIKWRCRE